MPNENSKPIIVFDLDGTLVETAPDLLDSLNHCLTISGLQPADNKALRSFVGQGGRVMIERAFAAQQKQIAGEALDALIEEFRSFYADNMPGHSSFYPGALQSMQNFADQGYLLAVCTNKFEGLARKLLTSLNEAERFAAICGGDTFAFNKPDPRHILETIAMAGGDRDRALMVGDSKADINAAKAAGIPVVAVDFGYTDLPVQHYEPSRVISHFDELSPQLADILLKQSA